MAPASSSSSVLDLSGVNRSEIDGKSILITGGTGSFGKKCIEILLQHFSPARVIVFSRDELKQHEMRASGFNNEALRYFIGDVRDKDRLVRAMKGVDIVIHTAALKQVPSCEYNPMEAILTNVMGTCNVADAAIDAGVKKVVALSTDKATNPVNLYGATKLCAEKLVVQSNAYAGKGATRLSCVRYGNVMGSRGSVIPVFMDQKKTGRITVTDDRMTRFWITLEQGVSFVLHCIQKMKGGEVFIPKIPSMSLTDLIETIAPEATIEKIGIRQGEKLHEMLLAEDEARYTKEFQDHYIIYPALDSWNTNQRSPGKALPDGFSYASNTNDWNLTPDELKELLDVSDVVPIRKVA